MLRLPLLIAVVLISAVFIGCANEGTAQKEVLQKRQNQLSGIALSEPLTQDAALMNECDDQTAATILNDAVEHEASKAAKLWRACQTLYACSSTTKNLIAEMFASNETFKVGFADLKKLDVSSIGAQVQALYLGGTSHVYLDVSMNSNAVACPLLLHELVHRFDPEAMKGEESLRSEYRAYWHQYAFMQELFLNPNKLGRMVSAPDLDSASGSQANARMIVPVITREIILNEIARIYKFKLDLSLLELYPALPLESFVAKPIVSE